ncbi:MAG TPA: hypothetical protein PKY31_02925 [Spirochaetota bacterium]|nr:hypothetical protein [Spirochaetota bacterium]
MNRIIPIAIVLSALIIPKTLYAWKFYTHRSSVIRAFEYMEGPGGTKMQKWAARFVKYAGGDDLPQRLGDKNGNTDEFCDTRIGGWWSGYVTSMDIPGLTMNFTGFWHFITMSRPGSFGNAYDGFTPGRTLTGAPGGINSLLKSMLFNREILNSLPAGRCISLPVDNAGAIEAYRFRAHHSGTRRFFSKTPASNYANFQDAVFEPCSNAAAYWYGQALEGTATGVTDLQHLDYLGHAMHMANDATVTHHVWNTLEHFHDSYESWVNANADALYNPAKVRELLDGFFRARGIPSEPGLRGVLIQEIVIHFAGLSYNMPAPLYSESLAVRTNCGTAQYNASVAANILILEKYVYDLNLAANRRRF